MRQQRGGPWTRWMWRRVRMRIALAVVVTGCNQDPCDAMPPGVTSTPPQVCGFDTFTAEQLRAIAIGELNVPGLPYTGPFTEADHLPSVPTHPGSDISTRAACRTCASVCDCKIVHRGCAAPLPANKAMPDNIVPETGFLSGGVDCASLLSMQPHQVLACRNGTCVFEDLANAGAALRHPDTSTGDGGNPDAADSGGR